MSTGYTEAATEHTEEGNQVTEECKIQGGKEIWRKLLDF